jgi:hypothetical protein
MTMSDLHPNAPKATAVLPWRVDESIEHTHCWHDRWLTRDVVGMVEWVQCCRCDKERKDAFRTRMSYPMMTHEERQR